MMKKLGFHIDDARSVRPASMSYAAR